LNQQLLPREVTDDPMYKGLHSLTIKGGMDNVDWSDAPIARYRAPKWTPPPAPTAAEVARRPRKAGRFLPTRTVSAGAPPK